jgi:hypothetical protein
MTIEGKKDGITELGQTVAAFELGVVSSLKGLVSPNEVGSIS